MFKSDEDVKKALLEIRKLKDMLDDNINNPAAKGKVPQEIKENFERLKIALNFFTEFNNQFLKSLGVDEREMGRLMQMHVPGRDPKTQSLFQEADKLRCEIIMSQANYLKKHFKDYLESNKPYAQTKKSKEQETTTKKKVKKKFKTMEQRMKWNKM